MADPIPAPPRGLVLTEHFDHAVLRLPRMVPQTSLRLRAALLANLGASLLLPLLAMLGDEAVLGGMLLWVGLLVAAMPALGWWLRRQSAPYVEMKITDRAIELTTTRPDRTIWLARDDIQRLEEADVGLLVHTSEGTVTVFSGRPAEQTAWVKALLARLTREAGAGGRASIPQALAELGLRAR